MNKHSLMGQILHSQEQLYLFPCTPSLVLPRCTFKAIAVSFWSWQRVCMWRDLEAVMSWGWLLPHNNAVVHAGHRALQEQWQWIAQVLELMKQLKAFLARKSSKTAFKLNHLSPTCLTNLAIERKEKNREKFLNFSLTLLLLIRINQGNSNQDARFVYPVALCSVLCRIWELMLLYPT